jgi:uncharacterized membrane protein YqhA
MQMKKISKSRWTILALVVVGLIVLFNITGCAMFEKQMTTMKGLVGFAGDKDIIVCEGTECVETPVATEEVKG